jgi:hypothetical protein
MVSSKSKPWLTQRRKAANNPLERSSSLRLCVRSLLLHARHEARDVNEGHNRNVEDVAEPPFGYAKIRLDSAPCAPHVDRSPILTMGNLKKKRRLKMNKHKRRKRLKSNRHKKRTWQK